MSGCVSWRTKPPQNVEHTAKVRFVAQTNVELNNIEVDIYNDLRDICTPRYRLQDTFVAVLEGIALDNGRQDLGMPLGESFSKSSKTEVLVEANQPLTYSVGFAFQHYVQTATGDPPPIAYLLFNPGACKIAQTFNPKKDMMYEITYEFDTAKEVCQSNVYEIYQSDDGSYGRKPVDAQKHLKECLIY